MAKCTVDTSDFERDLDRLIEQQLQQAIESGVYKACLFVESEGKENCPKDIGQLAGSIETEDPKKEAGEVVGYVSANTEYALFVHEGTSKMQGRPFLRNAVDNNANKIKKIIENSIKGGN